VNDTGRLEAFSDGVLAIAITLLVLDLRVPSRADKHETLAAALAHEWPAYAAYIVSFAVIGIIWINHHAMFKLIRRIDRRMLFANLALLLVVSAIPFPTRLFAEYLTAGGWDARVAAAVYSGTMLAMAFAFTGLWLAATRAKAGLLHEHLTPGEARGALRRFGLGVVAYSTTVVISFISAPVTLALHAALAIFYSFDQLRGAGPVAARGARQ
jgi:uncharacterized membrane protein